MGLSYGIGLSEALGFRNNGTVTGIVDGEQVHLPDAVVDRLLALAHVPEHVRVHEAFLEPGQDVWTSWAIEHAPVVLTISQLEGGRVPAPDLIEALQARSWGGSMPSTMADAFPTLPSIAIPGLPAPAADMPAWQRLSLGCRPFDATAAPFLAGLTYVSLDLLVEGLQERRALLEAGEGPVPDGFSVDEVLDVYRDMVATARLCQAHRLFFVTT